MKFGYARVSTQDQNLDRQIDNLIKDGIHKANIYCDKISGTKKSRPQFDKLLDVLQEGDMLVVTELSRLSRSAKDLIHIAELLMKKKVELVSLKENIDTTTAAGKMMFNVLSVLAQFERDIISERTQEGLRSARARGKSGGRPSVSNSKIDRALMLYDMKTLSVRDICQMTGISKPTLYKYLELRKKEG